MQVYPDQHAEYQRRHEKLWPEMRQMLKEHGAIKYQILNPETSTLFGYLEIEDEARWEQIALTPINQNGGTIWKILWKQILIARR